jgi:hypothetical protein
MEREGALDPGPTHGVPHTVHPEPEADRSAIGRVTGRELEHDAGRGHAALQGVALGYAWGTPTAALRGLKRFAA